MTRIAGRLALVTGAASGIGRALAVQLIAEGARVLIADIDAAAVTATAAEIGAEGFAVDVSDREAVLRLAAETRERFGPVGILANNAGVASLAPLAEMTEADWRWLIEVNLFGVINSVAAFLPQLTGDGGHILNTGSMAGLSPDAGLGGYSTSKFAITGFTEVLAEELRGTGVGVTLLAPGPVRTQLGTSSRNRPGGESGALRDADLSAGDGGGVRWMDPAHVARVAVRAIERDERYAITHPDWWPVVRDRHERIREAFERYPVWGEPSAD